MTGMLHGSPLLLGDNTIPGVRLPQEIQDLYPGIWKAISDIGCDPYPTIVEFVTYDQMSALAANGGFPRRYTHWSFGREYEEMARGYEFGMYKIYEMVINTNPCLLYCLDSNLLVDNVTVIAHALAHCDFFKNNIWFQKTSTNALNEFSDHAKRIQTYMDRYGVKRVTQFIDWVKHIEMLVDPSTSMEAIRPPEVKYVDSKEEFETRKYSVPETNGEKHEYMYRFMNPDKFLEKEQEDVKKKEIESEMQVFPGKERDVLRYLIYHAPLSTWQADITAMLYKESQYFYPQILTKMLNEGWASYVDSIIMSKQGMAGVKGIIRYSKHKAGVLGGDHSMNPYAVGYKILRYIEERWNKGQFGDDYDNCKDMKKKKNWDTKAMKGSEKLLEVRKFYNDLQLIREFVDQQFVDDFKMFTTKKFRRADGSVETVIDSRDVKDVKAHLLQRFSNGGIPDITLEDPNYANKGIFFLQHNWDGRPLMIKRSLDTLRGLWAVWNQGGNFRRPVAIATRNKNDREVVHVCTGLGKGDQATYTRKEFREHFA